MTYALEDADTEAKRPYRNEEWLREQYIEQGLQRDEVAEKCDVTGATISRWLKKHDIDTGDTVDDDVVTEIGELYEETQITQAEIADRVGVSEATVSRIIDREGFERHYDGSVHVRQDPSGYMRIVYKYGSERVTEIREHRLVAYAQCDLDFFGDEIVHHENGVKWDNRPENLSVMDRAAHQRRHS